MAQRNRLLRSRRKRAKLSQKKQGVFNKDKVFAKSYIDAKHQFYSKLDFKKFDARDDDFQMQSERLIVSTPTINDDTLIASYLRENRTYLKPFEPTRDPSYFQDETWTSYLLEERLDRWLVSGSKE